MAKKKPERSARRAPLDETPKVPLTAVDTERMAEDLNHPFFDHVGTSGAPVPEDWADPDFDTIDVPERPMPGFGTAFVLVALIALAASIAAEYTDELRYAFTDRSPIELGEADDLLDTPALWEGHSLVLPTNRYVRVGGGVDRPSTSRDKVYFKLIGAHIYVESFDNEHQTRILRNEERMTVAERSRPLELHTEPGRLIAFEDLPSRYVPVITFYSNATRTWFCGHTPSAELLAWRNNRRGRAEVDLLDELGRPPTDAELDERLGADAACQRGYLLIEGVSPRSASWFLAIYALLAGILVGSAWFLWRWIVAFRAARRHIPS